MDFKSEKKGYAKAEVDVYIQRMNREYSESLSVQKQAAAELKQKLSEAEKRIATYKEKESLVSKALTSAVAKADEIDKLARLKYTREMEQLKAFHDKWLKYYDKILRKYPLTDELVSVARFNDEMTSILNKTEQSQRPIETEDKNRREMRIGYVNISTDSEDEDGESDIPDFDPVEKIRAYLTKEKPKKADLRQDFEDDGEEKRSTQASSAPLRAAAKDFSDRSPSGFSFEEALNPKQDLEDIMKDLGLLMDEG